MEEKTTSPLDTLKLAFGVAVLIAGIVGYYYFEQESQLLRVIGVLVSVVVAIVIFMQTQMGRDLWKFVQGSRVELRKVVWPTRTEATQTTIAVMGFTLVLGIFFWLLDMFLLWATRGVTGLGS
ncbi:MAG: preprotein translocase subunit SecE [Pseudomonadota bacterium]